MTLFIEFDASTVVDVAQVYQPNWQLKHIEESGDLGEVLNTAGQTSFKLVLESQVFHGDSRDDLPDFYEGLLELLYWVSGIEPTLTIALDQQGFQVKLEFSREGDLVNLSINWDPRPTDRQGDQNSATSKCSLEARGLKCELVTFFSYVEAALLQAGFFEPTLSLGLRKANLLSSRPGSRIEV